MYSLRDMSLVVDVHLFGASLCTTDNCQQLQTHRRESCVPFFCSGIHVSLVDHVATPVPMHLAPECDNKLVAFVGRWKLNTVGGGIVLSSMHTLA